MKCNKLLINGMELRNYTIRKDEFEYRREAKGRSDGTKLFQQLMKYLNNCIFYKAKRICNHDLNDLGS